MQQIYFIELGTGVDLRGQSMTKAAVRAVRDAIGTNLIPSVPLLTGGEFEKLQVNVRLAVPDTAAELDLDAVREVFPVGTITFEVIQGGMATDNGIGDQAVIVNAAVEVGL
jgi:uncharacterized protein (TIGR02058 family)